jgi:hypothetical protein
LSVIIRILQQKIAIECVEKWDLFLKLIEQMNMEMIDRYCILFYNAIDQLELKPANY